MRNLSRFSFCAFSSCLLFLTMPAKALATDTYSSDSEPAPDIASANSHTQNWGGSEIFAWYTLGQGSRLAPREWFEGMLDPETGLPFGSSENMARFGYPSFFEGDTRPIGFVVDHDDQNVQWVGMNCAACHTSILTKGDETYLYHGGQSMGDFRKMLSSLVNTVASYANDPKALSVLPHADMIDEWLEDRANIDKALENTGDWGPGRLDAVSYISAKVNTVIHDFDSGKEIKQWSANAPVNPPPVWNAKQQQRVQYTGFVEIDYQRGKEPLVYRGAFLRNYIQALSVFSHTSYSPEKGLQTSVDSRNLVFLENTLGSLNSPQWPEAFGAIDVELAEKGREIFFGDKANCASCHGTLAYNDQDTMILDRSHTDYKKGDPYVTLVPMFDAKGEPKSYQTDIMALCNLENSWLETGKLYNIKRNYSVNNVLNDERYGNTASMLDITAFIANADYANNRMAIGKGVFASYLNDISGGFEDVYQKSKLYDEYGVWALKAPSPSDQNIIKNAWGYRSYFDERDNCAQLMNERGGSNYGYKARPLNGVWATAPFLHNGSVPTLMDLLKPQDCSGVDTQEQCRPQSFSFQGWEFDAENVGYVTHNQQDKENDFSVFDDEGVAIPGNWNGGHEFGTCASSKSCLTDQERLALVEYLKSI